jgi:hypothetical protein
MKSLGVNDKGAFCHPMCFSKAVFYRTKFIRRRIEAIAQ